MGSSWESGSVDPQRKVFNSRVARNRSSIKNICKSSFSGNFVESKVLQSLEKVESGIKNYTNLLEN